MGVETYVERERERAIWEIEKRSEVKRGRKVKVEREKRERKERKEKVGVETNVERGGDKKVRERGGAKETTCVKHLCFFWCKIRH